MHPGNRPGADRPSAVGGTRRTDGHRHRHAGAEDGRQFIGDTSTRQVGPIRTEGKRQFVEDVVGNEAEAWARIGEIVRADIVRRPREVRGCLCGVRLVGYATTV